MSRVWSIRHLWEGKSMLSFSLYCLCSYAWSLYCKEESESDGSQVGYITLIRGQCLGRDETSQIFVIDIIISHMEKAARINTRFFFACRGRTTNAARGRGRGGGGGGFNQSPPIQCICAISLWGAALSSSFVRSLPPRRVMNNRLSVCLKTPAGANDTAPRASLDPKWKRGIVVVGSLFCPRLHTMYTPTECYIAILPAFHVVCTTTCVHNREDRG